MTLLTCDASSHLRDYLSITGCHAKSAFDANATIHGAVCLKIFAQLRVKIITRCSANSIELPCESQLSLQTYIFNSDELAINCGRLPAQSSILCTIHGQETA